MAKKPKNITPVFSQNADEQKALAKQYGADQTSIQTLLDNLSALNTLRGLEGPGFKFTVAHTSFVPSEQAQENSYREPIGTKGIKLQVDGKDSGDELSVTAKKDGSYAVHSASGNILTTNPVRANHSIEGWRIDMEEKHKFDATLAIKKKEFEHTKTEPGGPRPERK